jgi:oxalate decarboxylase/phosphoglucose isomerase-like protein (cupin superfamily)
MQLKYHNHDIGGDIVKDNETYLLKDNKTLNNLVLSSTKLYRGQATRGHSHPGQEEVYFFVQGTGMMVVDEERFRVIGGDVILVPNGAFHRVINDGEMNLLFNCVFDGKRNH